jgi:hypothetical protein
MDVACNAKSVGRLQHAAAKAWSVGALKVIDMHYVSMSSSDTKKSSMSVRKQIAEQSEPMTDEHKQPQCRVLVGLAN